MTGAPTRCPVCRKAAALRSENSAFPFCSTRCKMVDLGKWLDEQYRVPATDSSREDEDTQEKA